MQYDPLSSDPFPTNEQFPAELVPITFFSYGDRLLGRILVAQGAGPHPTLLLLHGFPGDEQNGDLAHVFQRAGWNVMMFHYRGAWGSEGSFSFTHAFEDVLVALAFLRSPEIVTRCRIDPENVVLVGHSMGGFAALLSATQEASIRAVASLAGFHFGAFAQVLRKQPELIASTAQAWESSLPALHNASAEQLVQEVLIYEEQWNLYRYLDRLAGRSVLLVGGSRDEVAPLDIHHTPLISAFKQASASRVQSAVLSSDHAFSDARMAVAKHLLAWLDELK